MDFFLSKDWLNREGPYSFKAEHLIFIFISIIIGVGLSLLLRKKSKKTIKIVLTCLWAFATISEMAYFIFLYALTISDPVTYPFDIETMLPIHSCFMFMYICPVALFSKNKVIYKASNNFLVVVNMIMGFITMFVGCPSKGYSTFSYFGLQSLVYHALIFIVPLIMVVTNYYDIKKNDIFYGISLFGILALAIWIFDAITGSDYFYIYDGHCFGVLYSISENVPHIVWTLIVVSCYIITAFIIHYLVIWIKSLILKRKQNIDNNEPSQEDNFSKKNK